MLRRSLTLAVLLNANFMIHPGTLIIRCISLVIWLLRVHIVLHYPVESVLWVNHLPTFKANFLKAPFFDLKVGTVYSTPSYSVVCYGLSCSEKLTFLLTCMCSL